MSGGVRRVAAAGDTFAVSGASGGVGSIAIQLLRARGAPVLGIASEGYADWLRFLGVTPVHYWGWPIGFARPRRTGWTRSSTPSAAATSSSPSTWA